MERTLVFLKPDALHRRLTGEIIRRFERKGFNIIGMKMTRLGEDFVRQHYAVHEGKEFYEPLVNYVTSGPVVALVLEGKNAVSAVRRLMGETFGSQSPAGTIRGDYALSNRFNLVHGSDSKETAQREIEKFFAPEELFSYNPDHLRWIYDMTGSSPV